MAAPLPHSLCLFWVFYQRAIIIWATPLTLKTTGTNLMI